ncbi:hypothetical protein RxyAA322_07620 [Rubrobacter xylanophilus]|uniref:Glycosyltransferase 2-like domain-containing protein n=1 Tax=Rubrobacter xylanophilus TaxID=49319 RepID=A0A510HG42_9ACTN|nr:glycosyltransferase [Rubrobacter xylanophilus]BBL78908.1 hypothetical protein RxyAA322_07620 [Rubrobacter xylanophilus]
MPRPVAVIAARNEQDLLPQTLRALSSIPLALILVVDDGSTDATAATARTLGAQVLPAAPPDSPGDKGRALRLGILHARKISPEAPLLLADADLGASARHLSSLLAALGPDTPAAVAAFPPATRGGFGLVKRLARYEISRRTGHHPAEPLSGQRALLPAALDSLPGLAPGFGAETGMTLDLLVAGIVPAELPLPLHHRPTGKTPAGFLHRARQGRDVLRALRGERLPW